MLGDMVAGAGLSCFGCYCVWCGLLFCCVWFDCGCCFWGFKVLDDVEDKLHGLGVVWCA